MIARFLIALARFYQRALSPLKLPTCRFYPSCSEYFIEAVRLHGAFKGGSLGLWRILRCTPLSRGGYDPPPPGRPDKARDPNGDNHNDAPTPP
jgi:putative membrane protein insertion efficiency factor